jgi:hypothetical protein
MGSWEPGDYRFESYLSSQKLSPQYDTTDGHLVRVFSPNGKVEFRKPRGLRFANSGVLYCVARDEVVGFDFTSGECLGAIVRSPRLNGQALVLFP